MQCKRKYQWVKLPRCCLPQGKGVLGQWARLAARAAYRKGTGRYCGFENPVEPGMWAGGVVGLKSILGVKSRQAALGTLKRLQEMGYLRYTLDPGTKKLEYRLTDWVAACTGEACRSQGVYAYEGQGFLCLPRALPDRLVKQHAVFEEADALLDLWCHTVWQDPKNIFSHMAPVVQFGSLGAVLTLETLGSRWGWEKTKVWRFFQKHGDVFPLYRLPGAYGCLVFNARYPTEQSLEEMGRPLPSQEDLLRILREIRMCAGNAHITGTDNQRLNKMVLWYSAKVLSRQTGKSPVAVSAPLLRAYLSPCWNCKNVYKDCKEKRLDLEPVFSFCEIPALFDLERKVSHEDEREKLPELYDAIQCFDLPAGGPRAFGGPIHPR